jgi:hypothetical protein
VSCVAGCCCGSAGGDAARVCCSALQQHGGVVAGVMICSPVLAAQQAERGCHICASDGHIAAPATCI